MIPRTRDNVRDYGKYKVKQTLENLEWLFTLPKQYNLTKEDWYINFKKKLKEYDL